MMMVQLWQCAWQAMPAVLALVHTQSHTSARRACRHVAAAEGAFSVCQWLLDKGADVNALDRFQHTALEEAVRGGFTEICQLLSDAGAKLLENGNLVSLTDSSTASAVNLARMAGLEFGIEAEWEINARELTILNKLGEGEFGEVFRAKYHGTYVAVKQLKSSDQIALGDFRTEMSTLRKVHHPNAVQFLGACTRQQPYLIVTELMSCSLATAFSLVYSLTLRRQVRPPTHAPSGKLRAAHECCSAATLCAVCALQMRASWRLLQVSCVQLL